MEDLLRKLVESPSVSGSEGGVRELIKKEIEPYVDEIRIDRIGNLIAKKGSGSPKVMITAHMDEIGLMVKHIDDKGFIRFEPIGGWDAKILNAQKFRIYGSKGPVIGVTGIKPIHLQEREEERKVIKISEMFIDVGARSKKEVERMGVRIGDFISQYGEVEKLAGSRVTGHGFDDRIGCLELVEIVRKLKKFKGTLYAVGTVKEEIGLIGIRGSTFGVNPDIVISLDTTVSGGTPDLKPHEAVPMIGKGPVLLIKDAISIVEDKVKKWVQNVAKKNKIPLQFDILSGGATDASIVPTIREGIPSFAILTPSRYIHTPVEIVDMNDVKNVVKLVVALIGTAHKYL